MSMARVKTSGRPGLRREDNERLVKGTYHGARLTRQLAEAPLEWNFSIASLVLARSARE